MMRCVLCGQRYNRYCDALDAIAGTAANGGRIMDSKEAIKRLLDMRDDIDKRYREELARGGKADFDIEDDIAALEIGIEAISTKHGY